jgi:hypothetical protein
MHSRRRYQRIDRSDYSAFVATMKTTTMAFGCMSTQIHLVLDHHIPRRIVRHHRREFYCSTSASSRYVIVYSVIGIIIVNIYTADGEFIKQGI